MAFIRTVLGDISPQELGLCYAHEHIIIDACYVTEKTPDFQIDSVENAISELKEFYSVGGRAMVDSMPCDSGRNALKLAAVSRKSSIHIICPTGLHLAKYYPPNHWGERLNEDALAALFIADIEEGVDARDYGGPAPHRTPHRAGVIKVAGGRDQLSAREQRVFRAAAQAHKRTGCPVLTHTEEGTAAPEQIEIFRAADVDLSHVVVSHTDRKPDFGYHRELLSSGVVLEYDSAFRWKSHENPTLNLVLQLAPEFPHQIVLGMDAARRSYWKSYGGSPGLTFLLTTFAAQLRAAGLSEELLTNIFVHNPARAYSFSERRL
jgi:phosphotriesterase-related protein